MVEGIAVSNREHSVSEHHEVLHFSIGCGSFGSGKNVQRNEFPAYFD